MKVSRGPNRSNRCKLATALLIFVLGTKVAQSADPSEESGAEMTPSSESAVPAPAEEGVARNDSAPEVTPEISEGGQPERGDAPILDGELEKIRDPFKKPEISPPKAAAKAELEHYLSETFRLVGVITGPVQMRAMLVDSEGKTHFVSVGTKIGSGGGVVASISPNKIRIREKKAVVEIQLAQVPRHDAGQDSAKAAPSESKQKGEL